ncbi:MAG: hypothetical protein JWO20_3169 [Candidatus Angelobacter sp.]|nr:hypothetical protein [Candidatus Angelobacter sp.]
MSNSKRAIRLLFVLAATCLSALAQAPELDQKLPEIATGKVIPRVVTLSNSHHSYALYVPSSYTPQKKWPVIYAFDSRARGVNPVDMLKPMAEKYGYIVAGSNNSENGPVNPDIEAAEIMLKDTHKRFSIDDKRIYLTGFSGGGRLATIIALRCQCVTGVFSHGAGFPLNMKPSTEDHFLYFATTGVLEINYREIIELAKQLDDARFSSRIRHFVGGHQWAPTELWWEGIEWFELQAMKKGLKPVDAEFVSSQFEKAAEGAKSSKDKAEAHYAYSRIVQDFDGLRDVKEFAQKVAEFEKQKIPKVP